MTRVAVVVLFDVTGDPPDPHNWADAALRYALGGPRLGLPASMPRHPDRSHPDIDVTAVGICTIREALQSGALDIVTQQPRQIGETP